MPISRSAFGRLMGFRRSVSGRQIVANAKSSSRYESFARYSTVASPTGTDSNYLEDMYYKWKADPSSVNSSLQRYFRDIESGHPSTVPVDIDRSTGTVSRGQTSAVSDGLSDLKTRAIEFIRAYQVRGHNIASLDPLQMDDTRQTLESAKELNPKSYGFTEAELDTKIDFHSDKVAGFLGNSLPGSSLRQIIDKVQNTYAGTIGYEYMHIPDRAQCNWLRERIETARGIQFSKEEKLTILERLVYADQFEHFLSVKYPNQKRFGIEGGESFIVSMDAYIEQSSTHGVQNFVMGMAHRGRLNVLGNVIRKPLGDIFADFQGRSFDDNSAEGSGDVKYHLGLSRERELANGKKVRISILANPSHLEAVNPVVVGKTRAKQYYLGDKSRDQVVSMLVHGDAAFSGQGIVYETMELNGLHGYTVGGTVHYIINNQIGFTTDPKSLRSSPYCSDVAKGFDVPIFHVNGDDPEAVHFVSKLAADWRKEFKKDVVLDIVCYRRRGHNEGDTPLFTQPLMYHKIDKHPPTMDIYAQKLIKTGVITQDDFDAVKAKVMKVYQDAFQTIPEYQKSLKRDWMDSYWTNFKGTRQLARIKDTGVNTHLLRKVGNVISTYPSTFNIHRNLAKIFQQKHHTITSGEDIDWATAEGLAFGTLLMEGNHVRLSGQDVVRGTFSHRHASIFDQKTGEPYTFLDHLEGRSADFHVYNSNLSEFGVLGFELGYSMENPNALVLWEAQFGDFANGAQVMIDQFVSSGESKWLRQSGLVMLLPHGYDGGGPEHSSARLERYLQLCSDDPTKPGGEFEHQESNWAVANITSAANYYHALRRQVHREFRKPLVVMSPKSLLRFKGACSRLEEMGPQNLFRRLIPEVESDLLPADKVRRVIFCSGKVYFDLLKKRQMLADAGKPKDVALLRVEQISPFPYSLVAEEFAKYPKADLVWCQEEPQNMGAWFYVAPRLETALNNDRRPRYVGRSASASPATGWISKHEKELEKFLHDAFAH